jgi:hypothetical protein
MQDDREQNYTGDKQSNFAGTNPDKYGQPAENQDNPVDPEEAQNVAYDGERLSGEDAERARNKANSGTGKE